ncbi:MAG: hypothetical protein K0R66_143 [Gammaproteobacteria bacterium]|jgi:hypothetical protein|nr:hypothetical protein [Gammaproteobacteria bacterium]
MFSEKLMALNTSLKYVLGDDDFVSQAFDRKIFIFTKDYPSMSFEDRCALCRFVSLDQIRRDHKIKFSAEIDEIENIDLNESAKVKSLHELHREAVYGAKKFALDSSINKPTVYRHLAKLAIDCARKEKIEVPAYIANRADSTSTPIKTTKETDGLLGKSSVAGCCTIV